MILAYCTILPYPETSLFFVRRFSYLKVITLISGGDSGGAKTHVHSLLQNLSRTIEV